MYVLFLDGGPLMVVQSYKEDDLKKKKKYWAFNQAFFYKILFGS